MPASGAWTGAAVFAGSPDATPAPTNLTASLRDGEYQIGLREHRAGGNPAQVEFYRDATFELSFGRSFDAYGRLLRREDRVGLPFAGGSVFGTGGFFDHDLGYENNTPLPILETYSSFSGSSSFTNDFEFDTTASQGLFGPQPYTQESYTRDAAGRITGITTTFRVSSNIYTFQTLQATYSPTNHRQVTTWTSSAAREDLTYDARGLIATRNVDIRRWTPVVVPPGAPDPVPPYSLSSGALGTLTYEYDELGRNTLLTYPDGHRRVQVWDEVGRLTSRCYEYPAVAPTRCYTAQYDEVGNPILLTDPERSCAVGYDGLDRLRSVTCSDGQTELYDFNALGALSVNLGSAVDHQRPRLSGGGNAAAGLPATHAGQPVTLDSVGRVTSLGAAAVTWNRLGLPSEIAGQIIGYDAYGRVAVRGGTMLVYDGPNVATSARGAADYGGIDQQYGYDDIDHPLWVYVAGLDAVVWYELDIIGNVRRLRGGPRFTIYQTPPPPLASDLGGYKYTAFGKALPADAGTPAPTADGLALEQPLRWQGRPHTATGLYDFRNRIWSPDLGAFLSPDAFVYFHRQGTLWSWPGQNPFRNRDPWGLVVPSRQSDPWTQYFGFEGWVSFMDVGMFMFSSAGDAAKAGNYGEAALDAASGAAALWAAQSNFAFEAWTMAGMPGLGAALGPKSCPIKGPTIKVGSGGGATAGQRFKPEVRQQAFNENPTRTCVFCAREGEGTQVDHALARARGGNATLENAQLACPHCNASKGARDFPLTPPADYEGPWPPSHWKP